MATPVLDQISKRERLGHVSALISLEGSDLSHFDGTTGRKRGELGYVNLSVSSMPHPSGPEVDISLGTAVLHGDGHPSNFKPIPGPLGREHPPGTSWIIELLERKGPRPTALLGICCFILCLLGRCGCSFWLACGNESQAAGTAMPSSRMAWEGTQRRVGVDSHGFYTRLGNYFPSQAQSKAKKKQQLLIKKKITILPFSLGHQVHPSTATLTEKEI